MAKNTKLLQKANNALASGRYEHAINLLNKLLIEEPSNTEYLLLLGEGLMRNEQFSDALPFFAKVVEKDNKNLRALNNFGAALLRNKHLEEAKEILLWRLTQIISISIQIWAVFIKDYFSRKNPLKLHSK